MQEDAVDLVGMLFDVLLDERDFEPNVRRKIGRMLVPYVKVAVKDRRLFLYKGHPARRFLNAVAEACEGNHADGPQERELLERVDTYIDRVVSDFNEDVAIFETLEHELRAFMTQHRQRIEITERRAAEAQSGRERLEFAREQAVADVASASRPATPAAGAQRFHGSLCRPPPGAGHPARWRGVRALHRVVQGHRYAAVGIRPCRTRHAGRKHATARQAGLAAILSSSGCVGSAADDVIDALDECLQQVATSDSVELVEPEPVPCTQQQAAGTIAQDRWRPRPAGFRSGDGGTPART